MNIQTVRKDFSLRKLVDETVTQLPRRGSFGYVLNSGCWCVSLRGPLASQVQRRPKSTPQITKNSGKTAPSEKRASDASTICKGHRTNLPEKTCSLKVNVSPLVLLGTGSARKKAKESEICCLLMAVADLIPLFKVGPSAPKPPVSFQALSKSKSEPTS